MKERTTENERKKRNEMKGKKLKKRNERKGKKRRNERERKKN